MKKIILILFTFISFSSFATVDIKKDIPEVLTFNIDLISNYLENKEKLKNDMTLSEDEMKKMFSSSYEIQTKRLEDYDFRIIQEKD